MPAKEAVQEILDNAKSDASYEEIMYQIYVREKIERGLADIAARNIASDEEVEALFGSATIASAIP